MEREEPVIEKLEPQKIEPPAPTEIAEEPEEKQEEVEINAQWLQENLPILLDEAQDNPTYENVRRYMYAQRIVLDKTIQLSMLCDLLSL